MNMLKPTIASLLVAVSLPAAAAPVYSILDFDTTSASYAQVDGSGTRSVVYGTGENTAGVGGTSASKVSFDLTGVDPAGFTQTKVFYNFRNNGFSAPVSSNASDYEVSFDLRAEGFTGTSVNAAFKLLLGDAQFTDTVTYTGSYATTTLNLGGLTTNGNFDLGDFSTGSRQVEFAIVSSAKADRFGADAGNALYLDNFQINEVPEPASLALVGLGSLALLGRRRG